MPKDFLNKIDDYLQNKLTEQDRIDFEQELSVNEQLRESLHMQKIIHKAAKSKGRDQLKQRLQQIHQQTQQAPVAKTKKLWSYLATAAAAIALLIISIPFFNGNKTNTSQALFEAYYQPYNLKLASRNSNTTDIKIVQANELYSQSRFQEALNVIMELIDAEHQDSQLQLAAGVCQLELGQPQLARQHFDIIIKDQNNRLASQARWYWALSQLKEGNKEQATNQLKNLVADKYADKRKEANQLLKILE